MTKILDSICYGGVAIAWGDIISGMQSILGIIASLIAIAAGIISIVLKLKAALADGKIDDEELKDIQDSTDGVIEDINKRMGDKK